jgi:ubiquinone/menaquinone biosynthesis C-methylase UbiE
LPIYKTFHTVTVVNLDPPANAALEVNHVRVVKGDGRCLPFSDKAFDWVFSNAVIEHVGDWPDQQRFAAEIRRVAAKGYFVTTPNHYFPIEPHALLPLYQFYPRWLKPVALRVSPGYMREVENISLLSKRKLKRLFPDANVRSFNFGSSLIASWRV